MSENWLITNESIQELLDNYKSAPYSRASMCRLIYACALVVIIGFIGWIFIPDGTVVRDILDFVRLFACILNVFVFIKFKLYRTDGISLKNTENIQDIIAYINNQKEYIDNIIINLMNKSSLL